MATLVINVPKRKVGSKKKQDFDTTLETGIGEGYALSRAWADGCRAGCKVVLLGKEERKRAEGRLVRLVPGKKARNGLQRYDLHIAKLRLVSYTPERLNRNGVALKD